MIDTQKLMDKIKKLQWYREEGNRLTKMGVDKDTIWRTELLTKEVDIYLRIFPMSLVNRNEQGWGYQVLIGGKEYPLKEYVSAFDSKVVAPTAEVAMKWAEATLEKMLNGEDLENRNPENEKEYKLLLVSPKGYFHVIYGGKTLNKARRDLANLSDKWRAYPYRFIVEVNDFYYKRIPKGPKYNIERDSAYYDAKVVEAPEGFEFMKGWDVLKVQSWIVGKDLDSKWG